MSQFAVCRNPNPRTKNAIPFLLDIQSELLDTLATRVVVPLYDPAALRDGVLSTLMPRLDLDGGTYVAVIPELAGVPENSLGEKIGELSGRRDEIVAALDLLFTGS